MFRQVSLWSVSLVAVATLVSPAWAQTRAARPAAQPRLEVNRLRLTQVDPAADPFAPNGNVQPATLEVSDPVPAATADAVPGDPFGDAAVESVPKAETPAVRLPRPINDEAKAAPARAATPERPEPANPTDPLAAAARIEVILDRPTVIEANATPLPDVLSQIAKVSDGIPIVIDYKALENAAMAVDIEVTYNIHGIPLRQALETMLEPFELTYVVDKHLLKITTKEKAASQLSARVYHLSNMVSTPEQARDLVSVLQSSLRDQLTADDGETSIQTFGTAAIVRATYHGHRAVKELLTELADVPR